MAIEITQRIGSSINDTQQTEITAGTSIVRYIKLSTFLLLLAKKAFVPTLRNLQRGEKLEGGVPKVVWKNYADNLFSDLQPFVKWLLDRDQKSPSLPADLKNWTGRVKQEASRPGEIDYQQLDLLAEIWLHELSIRRCIWSWNDCTGGPSEALWKLYGNRGVAIKSEVGFVKSALEAAGVSRGIVAPVSYTIPRQILNEAAVAKSLPMLDKRYRPFPYLFKDASYRFEEEVRFVFGTGPESTWRKDGALFDIAPTAFVQEVWVAPDTPEDEKRAINALWNGVKDGLVSFSIPPTDAEQKVARFQFSEEPFSTNEDDCRDLFKDLPPVIPN